MIRPDVLGRPGLNYHANGSDSSSDPSLGPTDPKQIPNNNYNKPRLRSFESTGQWVPLFQTPDALDLYGRPGVPHMMAGIDFQSSGQMGPIKA